MRRGLPAALLVALVAAGCLAPPGVEPRGPPDAPDPRVDPPTVDRPPAGLNLDPGAPKLVRLVPEEAASGGDADAPLRATVRAEAAGGGAIHFLAKPHGEGGGAGSVGVAGSGARVDGALTGPPREAWFVFHARAGGLVVAWIDGAAWDARDERVLATTTRTVAPDLTGTDRATRLAVGAEDLDVALERRGTGTFVLRDESGETRARVDDAAVEALALVDAAGAASWTLACEGVCVGGVQARVTRYVPPEPGAEG